MEQYIRLTNQWGGKLVRCAEHIDRVRPYFDGRITEIIESAGECADCDCEKHHVEATLKMREALLSGRIVHTRFRSNFGGGVYAYRADPTSPSGVILDCSLDARRFDELFEELAAAGLVRRSLSPLSPTEGMRRAYA